MRILLLDDSPLIREAMAGLLGRTFGTVKIETAGTILGPWPTTSEPPHMVVANISSLAPADHPVIARLVAEMAPSPVVLLDSHARTIRGQAARTAGCRGYIPLTVAGDLIAAALNVVSAGGEYYPTFDAEAEVEPSPLRTLSARQRDVAKLLAEGKTNREIATDLGIAVPTVKLHVHAILSAIGVRNRTEAALWTRSAPGPWNTRPFQVRQGA